jgi:hypothetical protein
VKVYDVLLRVLEIPSKFLLDEGKMGMVGHCSLAIPPDSGRCGNWMNLIYFKMMDETAKKRYETKVTETLSRFFGIFSYVFVGR